MSAASAGPAKRKRATPDAKRMLKERSRLNVELQHVLRHQQNGTAPAHIHSAIDVRVKTDWDDIPSEYTARLQRLRLFVTQQLLCLHIEATMERIAAIDVKLYGTTT
jgi:hypothetical protein